jgi:hypothetical protein
MFRGPGRRIGDAPRSIPPLPHRPRLSQHASSTGRTSLHPQQITDHIKQLQQFIKAAWDTRCHNYTANITAEIDVKETINQWFNDSRSARGNIYLCTRKCAECCALTCLGCGEAPRKTDLHMINDHFLSWCCLDGSSPYTVDAVV